MAPPVKTTTITLDTPETWKSWLFVIKTMATGARVWEYIDPESLETPQTPIKPIKPTPSDVNEGKTTLGELNTAEKETYKLLLADYKEESIEINRILDNLQAIQSHIVTSITSNNTAYIEDQLTVHEMLVKLKNRLAPTDQARKIEVRRAYHSLKTTGKRTEVETWLRNWETTYTEAKSLKLPEVQGELPHFDFIQAIQSIDSTYASTLDYVINEKVENGETIPDFYTTIERFRNHRRRAQALRALSSHSTFATFNGRTSENKRPCYCGSTQHWKWEECNYITPSLRQAGWKGDLEIFKKVNEQIMNRRMHDPRRFFEKKYKYDGFNKIENEKKAKGDSTNTTPVGKDSNKTSNELESNKPAAFVTHLIHSSFQTGKNHSFKLYNSWIIDNASDIHVCNDQSRSRFHKTRDAVNDQLFAGKTSYTIEAFGTVTLSINTPNGIKDIELLDVALAPGYLTNLVSLHRLNTKGVHWNSEFPEYLRYNGQIFCHITQIDSYLVLENHSEHASFTNHTRTSQKPLHTTFTAARMHQVLGHASPEVIKHVSGDDVTIDHSIPCPKTLDCQTCALSKATRIVSRRAEVEFHASNTPFDRSTWDLIEMEPAYNGDRWMNHLQCAKYGYHIVNTHVSKADAFDYLEKAVNYVENIFHVKIRFMRLDGERSLGNRFISFNNTRGIKPEVTATDTPAQNGGSERAGEAIIRVSRALRIEARLPANLWNETVMASTYLLNRTPVRRLEWKTPHESVLKTKPHYAHLHVYGCKAYALDKTIPRKAKLQPRALIGYLVGYDSTNIYRIWIPSKEKVIRTRDVKFNDDQFYDPTDLDVGMVLREHAEQIIETLDLPELQPQEQDADDDEVLDTIVVEVPSMPTSENTTPSTGRNTLSNTASNQIQLLTPSPSNSPEPPVSTAENAQTTGGNNAGELQLVQQPRHSEIDGQFSESNILPHGSDRVRRPSRRAVYATALSNTKNLDSYHTAFSTAINTIRTTPPHRDKLPKEPKGWKQMQTHIHSTQFKMAADKEFKALIAKGTFEYADISILKPKEKPLPLMWVFTYKFDGNGYLVKHKARLVARGDLQTTQEETYAATLAAQTFRAITAVVAHFDLETRQYDVVNAFVNAMLSEPIACECAEGFEVDGKILWVRRALYGLKPSPYHWYREFTTTMEEELGLFPVPGTNCLFKNQWIILLFFVDDIYLAYHSKDQSKVDDFQRKLLNKYETRMLGEGDHFLGIRIVRNRAERKLWLVQDSYIEKLADKFNITSNWTPKTPISSTELTPFDGTATAQQIYAYQQRVGSVNFPAVITRPDISKSVSKLSEFLMNPGPKHIDAVNQTLLYLIQTKYRAVEFDGKLQRPRLFMTSSDASFADDSITRQSSYGYSIELFGGVIDWKAVKGKTVVTSSTESELMAISLTAKVFIQWQRFFRNINLDLQEDPTIYCDNLQTIRILTKEAPKLQTALKHVDIHQCWLRQEVQEGRIKVEWIATQDMVADGYTKLLPPQRHAQFVQQLRLVDISSQFDGKSTGTVYTESQFGHH